jgi:hypothetical protein
MKTILSVLSMIGLFVLFKVMSALGIGAGITLLGIFAVLITWGVVSALLSKLKKPEPTAYRPELEP